jgi:hypothetical protein
VLWGYDADMNGPMPAWAIASIRHRLPSILRRAGAEALARRVEKDGFDTASLDKVEKAMAKAWDRTFRDGVDMIAEGEAEYRRWKQVHPQFNTVDD